MSPVLPLFRSRKDGRRGMRVRCTRRVPLLSRLLNRGSPGAEPEFGVRLRTMPQFLVHGAQGREHPNLQGGKALFFSAKRLNLLEDLECKFFRENWRHSPRLSRSQMRRSEREENSEAGILPAWAAKFAQRWAGCPRSEFGVFVGHRDKKRTTRSYACSPCATRAAQKRTGKNRGLSGRYQAPVLTCYAHAEAADWLGFQT